MSFAIRKKLFLVLVLSLFFSPILVAMVKKFSFFDQENGKSLHSACRYVCKKVVPHVVISFGTGLGAAGILVGVVTIGGDNWDGVCGLCRGLFGGVSFGLAALSCMGGGAALVNCVKCFR